MTGAPAQTIRGHLEAHGDTAATLQHLLTTFGVDEDDRGGREGIAHALAAEGVSTDRDLAELSTDDPIELSLDEPEPPDAAALPAQPPVWDQPPGGAGAHSSGSRVKTLAAIAGVALLAAAAGVGAYFVGKASGEDLDAARAAGTAQGQRYGSARGTERGYDEGFKQGRRAGYRETYKKAYDSAHKKAVQGSPTTSGQ